MEEVKETNEIKERVGMQEEMVLKEKKSKMPIVCATLCICLVGGYVYYVQDLAKNTPIDKGTYVELEDKVETIDWSQIEITPDENAKITKFTIDELPDKLKELQQNVIRGTSILVDNTKNKISEMVEGKKEGYDKWGNPYIKEGQAYTWNYKTGKPNEAATKKLEEVISPINGHTYIYGVAGWFDDTKATEQNKLDELEAKGLIDSQGNTDIEHPSQQKLDEMFNSMELNFATLK